MTQGPLLLKNILNNYEKNAKMGHAPEREIVDRKEGALLEGNNDTLEDLSQAIQTIKQRIAQAQEKLSELREEETRH